MERAPAYGSDVTSEAGEVTRATEAGLSAVSARPRCPFRPARRQAKPQPPPPSPRRPRCMFTDRSLTARHVPDHRTWTCCRSVFRTRPFSGSASRPGTPASAGGWKSPRPRQRTWPRHRRGLRLPGLPSPLLRPSRGPGSIHRASRIPCRRKGCSRLQQRPRPVSSAMAARAGVRGSSCRPAGCPGRP